MTFLLPYAQFQSTAIPVVLNAFVPGVLSVIPMMLVVVITFPRRLNEAARRQYQKSHQQTAFDKLLRFHTWVPQGIDAVLHDTRRSGGKKSAISLCCMSAVILRDRKIRPQFRPLFGSRLWFCAFSDAP
jgi:hypothetical protein